jgi:hypothetical protein
MAVAVMAARRNPAIRRHDIFASAGSMNRIAGA